MPCMHVMNCDHAPSGFDSAKQSATIMMSSENLQSLYPSPDSSMADPTAGSGSRIGPSAPATHPDSWPMEVLMNMTDNLCEVLKAWMSFRDKIVTFSVERSIFRS